jgi:hypothetical protein
MDADQIAVARQRLDHRFDRGVRHEDARQPLEGLPLVIGIDPTGSNRPKTAQYEESYGSQRHDRKRDHDLGARDAEAAARSVAMAMHARRISRSGTLSRVTPTAPMHHANGPAMPVVATTELVFRRAGDAGVNGANGTNGFVLRVPPFALHPGQSLAVRGPSGSGKSTLLALLSGELAPAEGSVRVHFDGATHDLGALPEAARRAYRARRCGQVFQTFELVASLDALENVLLPFRLHGALQLDGAARAGAGAVRARGACGQGASPDPPPVARRTPARGDRARARHASVDRARR